MPRLLPRLVGYLKRNPFDQPNFHGPLTQKQKKGLKSSLKPVKPGDTSALHYVRERKQSILLDEGNLINNAKRHTHRKSLPPVVKLQKKQKSSTINYDVPREMSEQEKQWWSSPYLRMLSTPIRRCLLSKRHLPTDFMIRLTVLRVPSSRPESILVPDGILHPRYKNIQYGTGYYVACWKEALTALLERGSYKRITKNIITHDLLSEQIGHQLRTRVLQELELLHARLKASPKAYAGNVVLRRLSRSEWNTLQKTKQIPWGDALCVIVVPPLNKDSQTGQRPKPDSNLVPSIEELQASKTQKTIKNVLPLSVLHETKELLHDEPTEFLGDGHTPNARVPLYNGVTLFPRASQRAALLHNLSKIAGSEKRTNRISYESAEDIQNIKSSHAFILFSSPKTLIRADTVPLAISLWRLRMWEGGGWESCSWIAPIKRAALY